MTGQFRFISINALDKVKKNQATRRLARSHAVKQMLGNKQQQEQLSSDIFPKVIGQIKRCRLLSRSSVFSRAFTQYSALAWTTQLSSTLLCSRTVPCVSRNW
ncbi:hypothetical protein BJX66DRAFT_67661 [Aspergillus keveii]|uniref:Uncharacterized protein n=1 Tax=Aspergillus keveii TaxID=714993 RepID=A0ABR4FPI6_9EURO